MKILNRRFVYELIYAKMDLNCYAHNYFEEVQFAMENLLFPILEN